MSGTGRPGANDGDAYSRTASERSTIGEASRDSAIASPPAMLLPLRASGENTVRAACAASSHGTFGSRARSARRRVTVSTEEDRTCSAVCGSVTWK
jgi:hypothetical protein